MKSRLGADPLERTLIRDTREDKPAAKRTRIPAGPAAGAGDLAAEREIKAAYAKGKATNYYVDAQGELFQKVLVYLPFRLVRDLKKEAIDKRLSLSDLIRARLEGK